MKRYLVPAAIFLLLFSATAQATTSPEPENRIDWSVQQTWKVDTEPLDFVQALDNTKVFFLGSDSKVHIYDPTGNKIGWIPVDKGVTAIDIAPRGEALYLINKTTQEYTVLDINIIHDIDISGSPFFGDENAPVAIVVFSDFQCPHCGSVHPLLKQVLEQNKGKVKVVFKHFPLNMNGPAVPAALATIAAQNQGKFWQMHDAIFAAKGQIDQKNIDKMATEIGLDTEQFKKDLSSPVTMQLLQKDLTDAQKAGVSGTPVLYINGRKVKNRSMEAIQNMIDEELARQSRQ
jgi:protein-disulfide isomerase